MGYADVQRHLASIRDRLLSESAMDTRWLKSGFKGAHNKIRFTFKTCGGYAPRIQDIQVDELKVNGAIRRVCSMRRQGSSVDTLSNWVYGVQVDGFDQGPCEALSVGMYRASVFAGMTGAVDFEVTQDGARVLASVECQK